MPIDPFNMNQDTDSNSTNQNNNTSSNSPELEYLKRMNATLDKLLEAATRMSQQDAKDRFNSREEVRRNSRQSSNTYKNSARRTSRNAWDSFTDAFEDELIKGLLGSDFRDKIKEGLDDFADSLGVSLEDVPDVLGRELSKQALSAVQNSKLGENLTNRFNAWKDKSIKDIQQAYTTGQNNYWKNRAGREEAEARAQAQRAARMKSGTSKDADDTEDLIKEAQEEPKDTLSIFLNRVKAQHLEDVLPFILQNVSSCLESYVTAAINIAQRRRKFNAPPWIYSQARGPARSRLRNDGGDQAHQPNHAGRQARHRAAHLLFRV